MESVIGPEGRRILDIIKQHEKEEDGFVKEELDIKEDFAFLFVGHWLKGDTGQDRKDVGMLIRCFTEAFKDQEDQPAVFCAAQGRAAGHVGGHVDALCQRPG